MPDIDLEPGDYTERKPKGWRWKLPWSHADDTKLPMVMFFIALGGMAYFFAHRTELGPDMAFGAAALCGLGAGGMLVLWLRD